MFLMVETRGRWGSNVVMTDRRSTERDDIYSKEHEQLKEKKKKETSKDIKSRNNP